MRKLIILCISIHFLTLQSSHRLKQIVHQTQDVFQKFASKKRHSKCYWTIITCARQMNVENEPYAKEILLEIEEKEKNGQVLTDEYCNQKMKDLIKKTDWKKWNFSSKEVFEILRENDHIKTWVLYHEYGHAIMYAYLFEEAPTACAMFKENGALIGVTLTGPIAKMTYDFFDANDENFLEKGALHFFIYSIMKAMGGVAAQHVFFNFENTDTWEKAKTAPGAGSDSESVSNYLQKYFYAVYSTYVDHIALLKKTNSTAKIVLDIKKKGPLEEIFSRVFVLAYQDIEKNRKTRKQFSIFLNSESKDSILEPLYIETLEILKKNEYLLHEMYEINQHKNVLYKEDFVRIFENQHIIQEKWKNKSPILTRAHTVMGRDELLQDITFLYHAREDVKIKTNGQAIVRGLKEKKPLTDLFDTESFILYGQEMLVKEMLTRIQGFKVWHIIFDTLFNIPMPIYQVVEEPIDENQLKYAVKKPETWYRKLPQTIWQWLLNKLKVSRQ